MSAPRKFVLLRLTSFRYAFKGIATLVRSEPNAWLHLTATILVIAAGIYFRITAGEWAILCLAMGLVWVAEGINTAIEHLVDLASPDYHPLAGKAKDVAAGAVLLGAIFAVAVAAFIFVPHITALCCSVSTPKAPQP